MRKFLLFVLAVTILFTAALMFNPLTRPRLENTEPLISVSPNGDTTYLAENRAYHSYIYAVEEDGKASLLFKEPALIGKTRTMITDIMGLDGGLLLIRSSGSADAGTLRSFEVAFYDFETEKASTLYARSDGQNPGSVQATMLDGFIYVTLRAPSGETVEVYELDPSADRPEMVLVAAADAPEDLLILRAVYAKKLYCLLSDGRIVTFSGASSVYGTEFSGGSAQAFRLNGQNPFYTDVASRSVYYATEGISFRVDLPDGVEKVLSGSSTLDGKGFTAVVMDASDRYKLLSFDGSAFSEPATLRLSPAGNLFIAAAMWSTPTGVFVILCYLILLLGGYCLLGGRFFTRLASLILSLILLLSLATASGALHLTDDEAHNQRLGQIKSITASLLSSTDFSNIYSLEPFAQAPPLPLYPAGTPSNVTISFDLYALQGSEAVTVSSHTLPSGLSAEACYAPPVAETVSQVIKTNIPATTTSLRNGLSEAVYVVPVQDNRVTVGLLVAKASVNDLFFTRHLLFESLFLRCAVIILPLFSLIVLLIFFFMRPLRILPGQMNEIAAGRLTFGDITYRKGEIGDIQRSMQEMCLSLARRAHDTEKVLKSYYRFVPQGFERLLGHSSVLEIKSGDTVSVPCNIGILLVSNGDAVGSSSDGETFTSFLSRTFDAVYGAAKENRGMFISGDFDLSGLQILFPEDAASGVRFGLHLFKNERKALPKEQGAQPEFSLLLHSTRSLYSIVGNDEKAFACISSYELSMLSRMAPKLSAICCGVFVTEQYLKETNDRFSCRYVGFLSSRDERHIFKIYEVLDALSVSEKLQREQYDHQFQEAIRLYYKNDFYLARNTFSSLYKSCPGDLLARHYLFACERQFNNEDLTNIDYSLFGI